MDSLCKETIGSFISLPLDAEAHSRVFLIGSNATRSRYRSTTLIKLLKIKKRNLSRIVTVYSFTISTGILVLIE